VIAKPNLLMKLGAVTFGLLAIFNIAIGTYHTILFTFQGSQSLFTAAYGIPVSTADMSDSARLLGSDAIEVYSILLGGFGLLSVWATIGSLRGRRSGFWLNTFVLGIAQIAILYGLVIPGRLTGANAYAGFVLYALGVLLGGISLVRTRQLRDTSAVAIQSTQ
jgi:hypothetical protein